MQKLAYIPWPPGLPVPVLHCKSNRINSRHGKFNIPNQSMGTVLESDSMDVINSATNSMMETVHNLGIARVEVIIKIDSRRDKHVKMKEKVESIKKQMQ